MPVASAIGSLPQVSEFPKLINQNIQLKERFQRKKRIGVLIRNLACLNSFRIDNEVNPTT